MKKLHETKFEINIQTENILTDSDILEIRHSIKARMEGYSTDCPKSLKGSNIELKYISNDKSNKSNE